jgi:hypothetical protein
MKKVASILFAFIILLAGMHITVATHYCGGVAAASKVSFSGKLASCGMEDSENTCSKPVNGLNSRCCNDEVSVYSTDNTFAPAFPIVKIFAQKILHVFHIPASSQYHPISSSLSLFTSASPPDILLTSAVSLAGICVFRK